MSEPIEIDAATCSVCERSLLPGERANPYVTGNGSEVVVCELCKSRAEAAGWLRPDQAAERHRPGESGGRRQRGELIAGLRRRVERQRGERRRRREERAEALEDQQERIEAKARPRARRGEPEAEPEPERAARRPEPEPAEKPRSSGLGGLGPAEVLAAFNASEHRRTIAGLSRSLGAPRATAIAIRTASGHPGARITVAWDLAWYQWEVGPGERRPEVRQIAKGETIDQLRAVDRNWNLTVGEDGALGRRRPSER